MVASKTSILVAAVALGAASVYAAPAAVNKDITLSRRQADEPALIAREFDDDDELYAREFDDLDARDFEDDLEARDFDEDELFARELFEEELEARDFDDYGELIARALEVSPSKPSSTSTPSSTPTSSATTPSSTGTDATKDKHVLATTSTSAVDSDKKGHRKYKHKHHSHDICRPYKDAYMLLTGKASGEHKIDEHGLHKNGLHEHDLHEHGLHEHALHAHELDGHDHKHKDGHHKKHRHRHHHHRNQRHHQYTAEEIAHKCASEIAELGRAKHHFKHDVVVDASNDSKTLKIQTPEKVPETLTVQTSTKAKRGLTQLWARVVGQPSDAPATDTTSAGPGNPDTQSPAAGGADSVTPPTSDGPLPGQHKHHHHQHHQHHQHHHRKHNCHHNPHSKHCRHHHTHHRKHHRKHRKQDVTGSATPDAAKNPAESNGAPLSHAMVVGNLGPVTAGAAAPPVSRRSLEDEIWERSLASSLGLDEDYFTKRFYDEDAF